MPAMDGCYYDLSLVDLTGIEPTTLGRFDLNSDETNGKLTLVNYASEKVALGASILVTNEGSLDMLHDSWIDYNQGTGLYQGNNAYVSTSTIKITGIYATTVCGEGSTSLAMTLSP